MEKEKECPKCGGYLSTIGIYEDDNIKMYWIKCTNCPHGFEKKETKASKTPQDPEDNCG
jgi:hypothetical protein